MRQITQRAGELHHDIGLIVVVCQFDQIDKAAGTRARNLRNGCRPASKTREQQQQTVASVAPNV